MIPISLYVVIEILKLGLASYINKDIEMFDKETLSYSMSRNSDLIEELGQVEMVFSDKTGTLTQNKMIFKKCQINGVKYGELKPNEVWIKYFSSTLDIERQSRRHGYWRSQRDT